MELEQSIEIHITYTVTVGHHKALVSDIFLYALYPASGHGIESGIYNTHLPVLGIIVVYSHGIGRQIEGHIGVMQKIIREILLDNILLIARTDYEFVEAEGRIILHDMPEYRAFSYLYHRLWSQMTLLTDTCTESPG